MNNIDYLISASPVNEPEQVNRQFFKFDVLEAEIEDLSESNRDD